VPSRSLRRVLPALGLAAACAFRPAPSWPAILAEVRARHPDVPQVSIEALLAAESDPPPVLLDARGAEEYATSHLARAWHAPDEAAALKLLAGTEPEREIVVYCSVGIRSADLAERLRARGFTRVANLEGGIFAWANAGQPTYRGGERADGVHPFDERWGTLLVPERRAPLAGD
jgi:rhodanese-related sulfurtransferase